MEILYLLIPMSVGLVLVILAVFGWALHRGQFDDLEREGQRILEPETIGVDTDQSPSRRPPEQSFATFDRSDS